MFPGSLDNVLAQVFQPYFYYSMILLVISFICVKAFLRYDHSVSRRTRSAAYILPLMIPLLVFTVFHPATMASTVNGSSATGILIMSTNLGSANAPPFQSLFGQLQSFPGISPPPSIVLAFLPQQTEMLSVTGILCLVGLVIALCYFTVMTAFDDKIVARVFHIIPLKQEEYKQLQRNVDELSQELTMRPPTIGIMEDLRPNAFVAGYGNKTMLVFSIGMLNVLDEKELTAVAAHELSHIKNHDFFFKTFSYTLTMVSFLNPIGYFAASAAQREREMLADEDGAKLLEQPGILARALSKTYEVLRSFPKEDLTVRLTSSLFLVSPIARRPEILATHPRVNQRIENITKMATKTAKTRRNMAITVALSFLLILGGLMAGYPLVKIQTSFVEGQPSLVSAMSNEGLKLDLIPCLGTIRLQSSELVSPVEFVSTQLPEFIDGEKQPNITTLLLKDSYIAGSALNGIGANVSGATTEIAETYLLRTAEKAAPKTLHAAENGITAVYMGSWQAKATTDYSVNSPERSLGSSESYKSLFRQSQISATYTPSWLSTFPSPQAQRINFAIRPVSNEPPAFDNSIILILYLPSSHSTMQHEPMNFYIVLFGFTGNNEHGTCALVLAMFPTHTREMMS
jgi:heat shock protein HtpX